MHKVVVTGGAGFIGSHLSEELAGRGYRVVILDNLSTGRIENITHLLATRNVEFIERSITDLSTVQEAFKDARYVFHQAAIPSVPRSIQNPLATHDANVTGTLNVLLAARDNRVAKVVCASSSSVYGDTPTLPKIEDMPLNPRSPYAVSKLAGEYYCQVFEKVYALPTVCLRYFNVFGPRQNPKSQYAAVIPTFISRVMRGEPPIIFGDGGQSRDFTFIKDVVAANIQAAERDASGVFNIGRGGPGVTINELAGLVINLTGSTLAPVYREPRQGDVRHSIASITRAGTFGYKPRWNFQEGLVETIRSLEHGI